MIPMLDLRKQLEEIRDEVLLVLREVVESGQYILGKKVAEFERESAAYLCTKHAVGVASGTDALLLSLKALDIKQGDEVITTPFTFFATAETVLYLHATPVFVDIDPHTLNINPALIEEKITPKTRAIIPVHIFGYPADMESIGQIAQKHGLKIIEDCAQSFGASIRGRKTGSIGEAGAFSFYPSKNLGAYGDGGLIATSDDQIAERVRILRNHGSKGAYMHDAIGYNSRLDELQAAILLVKLKRIDEYNKKRKEKAALYSKLLKNAVICPPHDKDGASHVYHQYTLRHPKRDLIREKLREEGVSSMVYYPVPLHLQPALLSLGYKEGDLPNAEKAAREVFSLPIYPELPTEIIERITEIIKNASR
jgi:UDP-2-acetamido-2-deoxy-ribo-hexuluronate aminotransferase